MTALGSRPTKAAHPSRKKNTTNGNAEEEEGSHADVGDNLEKILRVYGSLEVVLGVVYAVARWITVVAGGTAIITVMVQYLRGI